jgi:cobalt-zinc-cadmium resistance protein CzcA
MIQKLIAAALRQRFLILAVALGVLVAGAWSYHQLPVDAYPDLSAPTVELNAQWPGHAAEEVERQITVPLETAVNGAPGLKALRSVSLYGLSSVSITFTDGTDRVAARNEIFQRLAEAELPDGVSPEMEPLFSPSGLIYRYVLESPDRSPQELKVLQDWVLYRRYKAVPGIADDSGFGGTTRQYQVVVDPNALNTYHVSVDDVVNALSSNNENAGGGFYQSGGQFYYVRGLGRLKQVEDIGNVVVATHSGVPIRVKNLGTVAIGHAPRLGKFGFNDNDDAVEGVIFLRTGEAAQTVLAEVQKLTRYLNDHVLPPDVRIRPFYDRSDLIQLTTHTVQHNLVIGMLLVTLILILFLRSLRTGLIVAVTIPLALATAFILLRWRHVPVNLLSLGAVDFGILVDAAVIMVENIFRELGERQEAGTDAAFHEVIFSAAKDVGRPIFYSTAVIIAAYVPIYALTGPSQKLFSPMADTVVFALLGTLIFSLTLLPVLASFILRKGVKDEEGKLYARFKAWYARALDVCMAWPKATIVGCCALFLITGLTLLGIGSEFMPKLDEGSLWVRAVMPYTISLDESEKLPP